MAEPSVRHAELQVQYILQLCTKKTTIKTEQLIYPVTSLVADFGGTLGLFLGFSFISIWDNLALFRISCKFIQRQFRKIEHDVQHTLD